MAARAPWPTSDACIEDPRFQGRPMQQDQWEDQPQPRPSGPGRLVLAGVVGAMALGVGLGLWARPASPMGPQTAFRPEDAVRPELQIVVDDRPAPIGPLLEVLSDDMAATGDTTPLPPRPAPEPAAPRRAAAGLMKVDTVVDPEPLLVPAAKVEKPKAKVPPRPKKLEAQKTRVEKPTVQTPKVRKARIETPKLQKAKIEARPKPQPKVKVAEAKSKTVGKPGKPQAAKLARTEKVKAAKLAKAEVKKAPQAKPHRLAAVVTAVKTTPRPLKAEVSRKKPGQLAAVKKPAPKLVRKPNVEKASLKPAPVAKKPAPRRLVIPRGEGPMRVARGEVCASADPGEAVVCADRRLGARDRQLQRAYRNAEAAGVPASSLQRQQARWLQARAAAAREAPWAVEDVYEARISELNDLTRDAREN